jgi:hypothetical protein
VSCCTSAENSQFNQQCLPCSPPCCQQVAREPRGTHHKWLWRRNCVHHHRQARFGRRMIGYVALFSKLDSSRLRDPCNLPFPSLQVLLLARDAAHSRMWL